MGLGQYLGKIVKVVSNNERYYGYVYVVNPNNGELWSIWADSELYKEEEKAISYVMKYMSRVNIKPKVFRTSRECLNYLKQYERDDIVFTFLVIDEYDYVEIINTGVRI